MGNSAGVSNVEDFYLVTDGVCDAITVRAVTHATKKIVHLPDCDMGTPAFHPLKRCLIIYLVCGRRRRARAKLHFIPGHLVSTMCSSRLIRSCGRAKLFVKTRRGSDLQ